MKNTRKLSIIVIAILTLTIIAMMSNYYARKNIDFEEVFNNISYFSNSNPEDMDELKTNNVYIFDTQQQWSAFKEKHLKGEPIPAINLIENEKIMFIHTKWEDLNWGISYYVESMDMKDKTLNITIKENGKVEKVSGFPEECWIHNILVCKVDGKNIKDGYSFNLMMDF